MIIRLKKAIKLRKNSKGELIFKNRDERYFSFSRSFVHVDLAPSAALG